MGLRKVSDEDRKRVVGYGAAIEEHLRARLLPKVLLIPCILSDPAAAGPTGATAPYRIYFYSHDLAEPPHVHVDRDENAAKCWVSPVALARNLGFSATELRRIGKVIEENEEVILETWNEYFRQ